MKKPYYLVPDIVRYLCLSTIILVHLSPQVLPFSKFQQPLLEKFFDLSIAGFGVGGYIFLSGFINEKTNKRIPLRQFLVKKIITIYPVYWTALGISILLRVLNLSFPVYPPQSPSVLGLGCSLGGLCAFINRWGGPYLSVGWFIGTIMVLYAVLPFLSQAMDRFGKLRTTTVVCAISLLARYYFVLKQTVPPYVVQWSPLAHLFEFSIGMYLAKVIPSPWLLPLKTERWKMIVRFFSTLNLPLYLIHYPFVFIYSDLVTSFMGSLFAFLVYITVVMMLSISLLCLSRPITSFLHGRFLSAN